MGVTGERVVAALVCIALHVVAAWWLLTLRERDDGRVDGRPAEALQVTWIERPGISPRPDPVADPARERRETPASRPAARPQALQVVASTQSTPATGVDAPAAPLDLSLAAPAIDFRRDPLARPANPSADAAPRMALQLEDRSIAGAWHRATKRRTCADLAAALRTSPASADAILASMARTGC